MTYQRIGTLQPFSPPNPQQHAASPPTTTAQQEHQQQPDQQSGDIKQQQQNHCTCPQSVLFRTTAVKHLKLLFRTTQIFQNQFISSMFKNIPKQEVHFVHREGKCTFSKILIFGLCWSGNALLVQLLHKVDLSSFHILF